MIGQKRGELTQRIKEASKKFMGVPLTRTELRLIPYLSFVMTNGQKLEPRKINPEERIILAKFKARGYLEGGASGMRITKEFWDFMCEILFLGYVDIDN